MALPDFAHRPLTTEETARLRVLADQARAAGAAGVCLPCWYRGAEARASCPGPDHDFDDSYDRQQDYERQAELRQARRDDDALAGDDG